jgi:hypothetical protein
MRLAPNVSLVSCCRCGRDGRPWDRLGDKAYCPDCQEAIVLGLAAPLREHTERNACAVCGRVGTMRFLTFPLHADAAVEIDLCPEHLRGLWGRCLGPHAYHQLRRSLRSLRLDVGQVFLLHDTFYDLQGRALRPAELAE